MAGDIARSHHNSSGQSDAGLSSASSLRVQLPFPTSGRRGWFHPQKHKWGIRCLNSYNPLFIMPERDQKFAPILCDPKRPPHFVSLGDSCPSNEISPFLDLLFPNVPERAKHNNVLIKVEELGSIEKYLNSQAYCSDYDVTIVIDQGADIEDKVRDKLDQLGRKARVNCPFHCCVLTMIKSVHEHAADGLFLLIWDGLGRWRPLLRSWGRSTTTLISGPVTDFYRSYTHILKSSQAQEGRQAKEGDASFIEFYSERLCDALGVSPVPTLAIESANSDDIRKLFQDCITWLAGSYLRVDTVIGVNNSPDTYSVDILNFDSTVDNLLQLASLTTSQETKDALLLSAKMKASFFVLQLRLLQYLMDAQDGAQDVDAINLHLADDIVRAQRLCPHLGIKNLEEFPELEVEDLVGFEEDVESELLYYENILISPEIDGLRTQLHPRNAIVSATYAIVNDTRPQTFGPLSARYAATEGITLRRRAVCTLWGPGNITLTAGSISRYLRQIRPRTRIIDEEIELNPIELEWINDPEALAIDRRIPRDQFTLANYNPDTTLDRRIKFRYIRLEGLREIALAINASAEGDDVSTLAWNILRKISPTVLIDEPNNPAPHRVLRSAPAVRSRIDLGTLENWQHFARQVN